MSYSSVIKSLPPTLHYILRQPTYIAGIASVGIHALLWVVLPLLPIHSSTPEEPDIQRPVSLVELTPTEQSRLPDFSTPQVTLPSAPDPSDLYSLSPLPNSFPPIPTQPTTPSYPTFPSIPSFIPPPPTFTIPPSYTLPRTPQIQIPTRSPQSPVQPSVTPTPSPSSTATPTPGAQATNSSPTPTPTTSPSASPSPQPGERLRQDLIARRQELQQLFSYNETGITNTEALANYTQWFAKVTEFLGNDWDGKNATEVSISAPYPPEACFRQLRGIAIVGVVTNPEGQVLDDPAPILLRSSGYQFFNLRALEIVKSHEFEATRKKKAYQVSVEFTPNSQRCSNMSSPSPSSPSSPDGSG